ncbi:hypothetical protein PHLGIDRAFT_345786 [Phlebiopsis gigantea 11061_1 CR5-6]|uniref:Uncharacterized protein n=1 Tax=Phlebiopsis gigantea (strain 11061_1 CR5-6) TaxID=745531 RepID=A0A0C3S1N1_PHLG1|nr:hypothetical protein PHLGIDRAFT_345786 [Phlebiopsis gigantea 11061_1 CR5-6]
MLSSDPQTRTAYGRRCTAATRRGRRAQQRALRTPRKTTGPTYLARTEHPDALYLLMVARQNSREPLGRARPREAPEALHERIASPPHRSDVLMLPPRCCRRVRTHDRASSTTSLRGGCFGRCWPESVLLDHVLRAGPQRSQRCTERGQINAIKALLSDTVMIALCSGRD